MADAPNTNDELYPIAVLIDELKVSLSLPPSPLLGPANFVPPSTMTSCSDSTLFTASPPSPSPSVPSAREKSSSLSSMVSCPLPPASSFASSPNASIAESVEDEDEVLVALSEELGSFIEYVGGPQWGHVLLSPLENLAAIEEPVVRDKVMLVPSETALQDLLLITGRPSNPSTRFVPTSRLSRSKNTLFLFPSGSPRQIGSRPRSRAVVSTPPPTRR